ncbi:MAG: hypothetical protein HIU91_14775 [Acidobacteria bacterium]|nr:hypothetical protein [Acidobacteriota bacterium]
MSSTVFASTTSAEQSVSTQTLQLPGTPASWVAAATQNELAIVRSQGDLPLRYLQHKIDARGDTTREIIESKQGNVARLLRRNGQPLTAAENNAERDRLESNLVHPDEVARHRKRAEDMRNEALELIPLLPQAMLYTFTTGQPQPRHASSPQVVLDFQPNPAFHPPTMLSEALTGMAGRVWIDQNTHCITRIESKILHPVNFGFGILARVYPGGTIEFEQTQVNADRWAYSHLEEHLTARVFMVRTLPQDTTITSWDFRRMPAQLTYQQAIHDLLAMPVPLQ